MPKRRVVITEVADEELQAIVEYIDRDDPAAALGFVENVERQILTLADFPYAGVVPKNRRLALKGYRMLIIGNYLVFYCLPNEKTVEIRRILSGKREYGFLL